LKKKLILIPLLILVLVATLAIGCTGDQGLKGPKGNTGGQGIQGERGPQGEQGLQGEVGLQGVIGRTGPTGVAGSAGAKGDQGIQGVLGAAGSPGSTGATGAIGSTGAQGEVGPTFSNLGILLYVEDGGEEVAYVTYILDEPIALEDLVELTFFQELVYGGVGSGQYGANVILGIDVDGDGYEADDLAWHIGETQHKSEVLGNDTFIEMDGVLFYPNPKRVEALSVGKWWTPNTTGNGLSVDLYCLFPELLTRISEGGWDTNVPNTSVQVSLIRLIIGGSGSWMDTAFRVTSDMIPSEVGMYP